MRTLGSAFMLAFALILVGCKPASDPAKDKNKAEGEAKPAPTKDKNKGAKVELSVQEKLLGKWEGTNHEGFYEFLKDGKVKSSRRLPDGKMLDLEGTYKLVHGSVRPRSPAQTTLETQAKVGHKVYEGRYTIKTLTETTLILQSLQTSERVLEYKKK